jgi:hypothetical protein
VFQELKLRYGPYNRDRRAAARCVRVIMRPLHRSHRIAPLAAIAARRPSYLDGGDDHDDRGGSAVRLPGAALILIALLLAHSAAAAAPSL